MACRLLAKPVMTFHRSHVKKMFWTKMISKGANDEILIWLSSVIFPPLENELNKFTAQNFKGPSSMA